MKIAINRQHVNKQPTPTPADWWGWFNGQFENEDCDAADVLMYARWGWSYTAQHKEYRKADNFICGQHLDLDLDDGRHTMASLLADDFIRDNASFIYETASSTPDHPRLRVFFQLDRPIYDASKYRLLRDALLHRYPTADKSHRDVCRLAFGSQDCQYTWLGYLLTLETAAAGLVTPYKQQLDQALRKEEKTAVKPVKRPAIRLPQNQVSPQFLAGKLAYLLQRVETAPDGEKHPTLLKTAVSLGGYVAAGYYDLADVRLALGDAIRANRNNVKSLETADKCIEDGLNYGMARPLRIDGRQYTPPTPPVELESYSVVSGDLSVLERQIA